MHLYPVLRGAWDRLPFTWAPSPVLQPLSASVILYWAIGSSVEYNASLAVFLPFGWCSLNAFSPSGVAKCSTVSGSSSSPLWIPQEEPRLMWAENGIYRLRSRFLSVFCAGAYWCVFASRLTGGKWQLGSKERDKKSSRKLQLLLDPGICW